ncbi:MAG: D-alanine--D-alanine ligase [Bordetella sp.]|nr:MAG: D-alanine--D-alanine ligase [Bordetella sp.]
MIDQFGKVGILYGGLSSERKISLMSGLSIYESLKNKDVNVHLFDTGKKTLSELENSEFDRVFIALHGRYGEDGCIQGVLELLRIPYTGSGPIASNLAMNKVLAKQIWLQNNLPTPPFLILKKNHDFSFIAKKLGFPFVFKPTQEGSTIGINKVNDDSHINDAYIDSLKYSFEVFAEKFITGRELTVVVSKQKETIQCLPIIEIIAPNGNYSYENKYFSDKTRYCCPANLKLEIKQNIVNISEMAFSVLGCDGWARLDIILDKENQAWILEINTLPGMTNHSLVPMAASRIGISYQQLCLKILKQASCKIHSFK